MIVNNSAHHSHSGSASHCRADSILRARLFIFRERTGQSCHHCGLTVVVHKGGGRRRHWHLEYVCIMMTSYGYSTLCSCYDPVTDRATSYINIMDNEKNRRQLKKNLIGKSNFLEIWY